MTGMMMTEEEAQQTRCCGPDGCGETYGGQGLPRWCIGSKCAAWRWASKDHRGAFVREQHMPVGTTSELPQIAGHRWYRGEKDATGGVVWGLFSMKGWCGLAGRPES